MPEKVLKQWERDAINIESQDLKKVALKIELNFPLNRFEACAYLGIHKKMLEDLTLKGDLKSVNNGRRVFYTGHTLRDYMNDLSKSSEKQLTAKQYGKLQ